MFITPKKSLISLTLSITLLAPFAHASNDEEMVKSIMKLRADVESLYTKIDENKVAYKAQMKSIALQNADNDAQINRKSTSIKLADLELQKIKVKIENTSTSNLELKPLIKELATNLKNSITNGIPFKIQERLASLSKIEKDLEEKLITGERALALLWASYDDNIRLTKEIGLFKQNINVNSRDILAQVAKVGSVLLYFKTPNKEVGYIKKDGSTYQTIVVNDKEEIKSINNLFDALTKQIRTGFFTLPNALVLQGVK